METIVVQAANAEDLKMIEEFLKKNKMNYPGASPLGILEQPQLI